ncbi:hypothetical protein [Paraburkholderia terrae]
MKRTLALVLLALACAGALMQAVGQITPQLRDHVMQQAQSLTFSSSALQEELQVTGFLSDPKTEQIVKRSPPAHALAWAALQAERKQPGAAVELLHFVAQGIAAHHADAIRYEPKLRAYFSQFPTNAPVPSPQARRFNFDRTVPSAPDVAAQLPQGAKALLEPLSKYSLVHPGGVHGLMVDVLGLKATEAMDIEQSSGDVSDALLTGIRHAPIPPPQEQRLRDMIAALLLHGGDAILHEEAVKLFGSDRLASSDGRDQRREPLVALREASDESVSHDATREHDEIVALATKIVANLNNASHRPSPAGDFPPPSPPPSPAPSPLSSHPPPRPRAGMPRTPSFELTARQLHSESIEPVAPMPNFAQMRDMGGGRGGGGIIMGSAVTSTVSGAPLVISFRRIERSDLVVPVVAMKDGRNLSGSPVRQDVLLAAYRMSCGDHGRQVTRIPADGSSGAVLISLLVRQQRPVNVSEFLVHPAISDLAIGRELIIVDGANFLFGKQLDNRLGDSSNSPSPADATVLNMRQWRFAVRHRQFGGWYRFAERSSMISAQGDRLDVQAQSGESRRVLFEFLRPADPAGTTNGVPERSVIISDAPDALPEFATLNDFLKTAAILRWGTTAGAKCWINGGLDVKKFANVRTVVFRGDSATFDSRSAVDIELEQVQAIIKEAMASVPKNKLADAKLLKDAIARERKLSLLQQEMKVRGYSGTIIEKATRTAAKSEIPGGVNPLDCALTTIVRKDMSAADIQRWQSLPHCKDNDADDICELKLQLVIDAFTRIEPWSQPFFMARM